MPTYSFRNKESGEIFDKFMKMSEKDQFLIDNPNLEQTLTGAPAMVDPVRLGLRKVPDGFRDVLKKVHERMPGSVLKDNIR